MQTLTKRVILILLVCFFVFSLTVNALPIDGNWHSCETYSLDLGNGWGFVTVPPTEDNLIPFVVPSMSGAAQISKYAWLCIPLSGDNWQLDPVRKMEIRFIMSAQTTTAGSEMVYDVLGGDQTPWYQSTDRLGLTNLTPNIGEKIGAYYYVTPFNGPSKGVEDGNEYYVSGALVDIIIPADRFTSDARCIWIPFQVSSIQSSLRVGITSLEIRQASALTDNEIFTEILNSIQELAQSQGLTKEEVQEAILGALNQFTAQDKNEANGISGQLDDIISNLEGKTKLEDVKNILESYAALVDQPEKDMDLSTPELSLTLSGQVVKVLPAIDWNVTEAVNKMLLEARKKPGFSQVINLIGFIYNASVGLGIYKMGWYAIRKAFGIGEGEKKDE